jgi:hypothetical protein
LILEQDDNTITIGALNSNIRILDKRVADAGMSLSTDAYDPAMLDRF